MLRSNSKQWSCVCLLYTKHHIPYSGLNQIIADLMTKVSPYARLRSLVVVVSRWVTISRGQLLVHTVVRVTARTSITQKQRQQQQ